MRMKTAAALALAWPGVAAAAALGVSALLRAGLNVQLGEAPPYFIPAWVPTAALLGIAVGALWLAWRGYRAEKPLSSDRLTLAALGAVVLLMVVALGLEQAGSPLSRLADSSALAPLCVAAGALAAAMLVTDARWAKWGGAVTAAIALWAGGTRIRAAEPETTMTLAAATAEEAGVIDLEGTISDLRLSPHGSRYLVHRFEQGMSYYREPSGEAAWDTFSKGYGPTRSLATSLDPQRRVALREDFTAFHEGFPTELGICVPRGYWLTIGVRV